MARTFYKCNSLKKLLLGSNFGNPIDRYYYCESTLTTLDGIASELFVFDLPSLTSLTVSDKNTSYGVKGNILYCIERLSAEEAAQDPDHVYSKELIGFYNVGNKLVQVPADIVRLGVGYGYMSAIGKTGTTFVIAEKSELYSQLLKYKLKYNFGYSVQTVACSKKHSYEIYRRGSDGKSFYLFCSCGKKLAGTIVKNADGRNEFCIAGKPLTAVVINGTDSSGKNLSRCYIKNGLVQKGVWIIGGKIFYFDPEYNRCAITGKRPDAKNLVSFGGVSDGGYLSGALYTVNGKTYGYDKDGKRISGWYIFNRQYYYFDIKTGVMYTGIKTVDGKKYCFGANGKARSGIISINGKLYYFRQETELILSSMQASNNKCLHGAMMYGAQCIFNQYYYFDVKTGVMFNKGIKKRQ